MPVSATGIARRDAVSSVLRNVSALEGYMGRVQYHARGRGRGSLKGWRWDGVRLHGGCIGDVRDANQCVEIMHV